MAGKKENIKALFTNTRSRVIIVFTVVLLITAVVIGLTKLIGRGNNTSTSGVPGAPTIQSIPGGLDPTAQYAKLQQSQNINQAKSALKTGDSAIPTIVRSQAIGQGIQVVGSQPGQGGVGFSALAREDEAGLQKNQWLQTLQNSNCSKSSVNQVINQGAKLPDVKSVCSCVQLKDNGLPIDQLKQVCSCKELKAAGFSVRQLKDNGFTAGQLRLCGFDACELKNAGFTAQQMKDGGFSDGELKGAGFSDNDIAKVSGLPDGVTQADVRNAGCSASALSRLRQEGVTAAAIRRINGCSAAQLKAAGFTAADLKNAGFTAADLKKAGFSAADLKQAGFSARDLLNAGFTPTDLANAGFSPAAIAAAESELPPGITPDDIHKAGCDVTSLTNERIAGVSAKLIRKYAGCSAQALKNAGFTDDDLTNAGFTPAQIRAASIPDDAAIRAAGCDPAKLRVLREEGVSAERIHSLNGCSAAQLKAAGFDAKDLLAAGFTPQELLAAGFTPQDLAAAGVNPASLIAEGRKSDCSIASLTAAHKAGVSATTIRETLGCSAAAMKAAGYTAAELRAAGFTAAELKAAGFTAAQLKAAGFSAKELRDAGFSAADLKAAGFTAAELKDAGFSAADLKAAGFTAAQLKAAGFSAKELKDAGFSANELKAAGYSAKDLKDAGFSADELRAAGFSPRDLQNAGYTNAEVANAGYSPAELANTGIVGSEVAGLNDDTNPLNNTGTNTMPSPFSKPKATNPQGNNAQQLQQILTRQNKQLADQRYQQKIQQRTSEMLTSANQALSQWKKAPTQAYVAGSASKEESSVLKARRAANGSVNIDNTVNAAGGGGMQEPKALIKTGDILFAVIDTSINSDEPGPILATIVSGKYKNAKLIGSFTLPTNADKMIISFNTLSVPGASKTTSINAVAIDANTARTALSSYTDHHYLLRYGSLFASSFLEGIGGAFQSADTTVTVGGTGGGDNITVQNGISRSALQNAIIALGDVGKAWGQVAQQQFNTPTTVEVYSGTGVGVLFTSDVRSL